MLAEADRNMATIEAAVDRAVLDSVNWRGEECVVERRIAAFDFDLADSCVESLFPATIFASCPALRPLE